MPKEELNSEKILTLDPGAVIESQDSKENAAWAEMRNAFRARRILTGTLDALEETPGGAKLAIVYYKEFRVAIPFSEMMLTLADSDTFGEKGLRESKILGNMLGSEIDFIVKGMDTKTHSIVASRKEAMFKKRQTFFLTASSDGSYLIYEGRIVQARVLAVAEKVIRVEVFGVECPIFARDLSWDWLGDCRDHYTVGDRILVRVQQVERDSIESINLRVDVRSIVESDTREKLSKCKLQAKYAGVITDVVNGNFFIRLSNGVNAVAQTCYDRRTPGKRDEVCFVLTRIDADHGRALGIITRIIRQNV